MSKEIIFIQGAGTGAHEEDGKLAASLEQNLGAGYKITYPQMPNEDYPEYDAWWPQIEAAIKESISPLILVGHSLGGYMLVKYLSEQKVPTKQIVAICLIATPYPGGDKNWDFDDFDLPENFGSKMPTGSQIFLYQSPDDEIVSFAHLALYAKELPKASVRQTTGGHQLGNDLSMVAKDLTL